MKEKMISKIYYIIDKKYYKQNYDHIQKNGVWFSGHKIEIFQYFQNRKPTYSYATFYMPNFNLTFEKKFATIHRVGFYFFGPKRVLKIELKKMARQID